MSKEKVKEKILTINDAKKGFLKLVNGFYGNNKHEVFRDFVEMSAISIRNSFEKSEKLELDYLIIAKKYKKEELEDFASMLAITALGLEISHNDFLGSMFQELELHNTNTGQFFTPYHVCLMMAKMMVDTGETQKKVSLNEITTINDPACGAGATLIAVDQILKEAGINPAYNAYFMAQDIDKMACCMCYIQLSLLGMSGCVIWQNTLSDEKFDKPWQTPIANLYSWRFRRLFSKNENEKKQRKRNKGTVALENVRCWLDGEENTILECMDRKKEKASLCCIQCGTSPENMPVKIAR